MEAADVRLNNYKVEPINQHDWLCDSKSPLSPKMTDSLPVTATPREDAIRFSARLCLPRSTTADEIESLTSRMLRELGLEDCAETIVQ
jgi:hypothetical protein